MPCTPSRHRRLAAGNVTLPYYQLDAVLIKEVIHHMHDQAAVLDGLTRLLAPQDRLLGVMLPRIEYPSDDRSRTPPHAVTDRPAVAEAVD